MVPHDLISVIGSELRTSSLKVAEAFGKLHKHVIAKIESLDCSAEFTSANFSAHVHQVEIGQGAKRESKHYEMTKDGFMFLVMGFTGKKAARIKEAYINAFNWMAAQLFGRPAAAKTTADERTPLRAAVSLLVGKKSLMYPEAYALIHQRFAVDSIEKLAPEQIGQAVEYAHRLALDCEPLPAPQQELALVEGGYFVSNREAFALHNVLTLAEGMCETLGVVENPLRDVKSTLASKVAGLCGEFRFVKSEIRQLRAHCDAVYQPVAQRLLHLA
ncbi:hypothetical protein EBB06_12470 [Crenobacter cavernae]|uniref:Rha family transcriptional regulator n=2 Tax=Crenobacter cavernae TaxID=2290923 RepID=A0ABY0FAN6_9NEIS|nr:hypothetical protein EBB06_12470 [Crenobacter cavernae]